MGEVCAYGKILMGDAPAAVRKSTSAGWTATLFRVDGVILAAKLAALAAFALKVGPEL